MPLPRARLLLACLLMATTIDSAAALCAYLCAHQSAPPTRAVDTASHNCHEVAVAPGGDGSLTPGPVRCAPDRPALITARGDASAFNRAIVLDHLVAVVAVDDSQTSVYFLESLRSAPHGTPPGAPGTLRI
jgi:hypothetical protein